MTGELRHYHFQKEHQWEDISVAPVTECADDLFRAEHESVLSARAVVASPIVSGADGLLALEIAESAIVLSKNRKLPKCFPYPVLHPAINYKE